MDIRRILAELRTERHRIDQAIAAIEGIGRDGSKPTAKSRPGAARRPRRRMSAATRRRMSEMMKARWAARKKKGKAA